MDMVGNAVDFQEFSAVAAHDASHVIEKRLFHRRPNQWSPLFGAEDEVVEQIRVGARH
jgi:hypothetical protein